MCKTYVHVLHSLLNMQIWDVVTVLSMVAWAPWQRHAFVHSHLPLHRQRARPNKMSQPDYPRHLFNQPFEASQLGFVATIWLEIKMRFTTLNNCWIHCDTALMKVEDFARDCSISQSWLTQSVTPQIKHICSAALRTVSAGLILIYMEKFLHSDWLRAVQFFF